MPQLGETVTEGTITRWLKQVGDQVSEDEPLVEVSTDKVDTEIPSPASGTLLEIVANEDDTVEVGGRIAVIGSGSGAASAPAQPTPPAPAPAPAVQTSQAPPPPPAHPPAPRHAAPHPPPPAQPPAPPTPPAPAAPAAAAAPSADGASAPYVTP